MEKFLYDTTPSTPQQSASALAGRACLVAGSAKSGTTLLVALLDGHPDLLTIPEETAYFPTVRRKYRKASRERQARYLMEEAECRLLFEKETIFHGNRDYRNFPREQLRKEFSQAAADPQRRGEDLLALLAESLARVQGRELSSIQWWLEKTPANRWCVEDIRAVFPQGRMLLTMRDPRAVAAAIIQRAKNKADRRFSLYLCVKYWLQSARLAWQERDATDLLVIRFESLLRSPETSMRRVCRFLGVNYREEMTQPTKAGVPWKGNSTGGQGFRGIDTSPIDRWKKTLTPSELAFVESLAGPWMERFDYAPVQKARSPLDVWRRHPQETWPEWLKNRRRWIGDMLTGLWRLDP